MRRLFSILFTFLWVLLLSHAQGQSYFRVIGELPHLPMVDPVTIVTPQTGMLIFSSSDSKPLIYTGSVWESLCTTNISAATTQDYFVVKDGIPFLPVFGAAPSGLLVSGTIYYSTSSNAVMVYNGSMWSKMVDMPGGTFSLNSSFSSGVDVKTVRLPVLNTDPTIPGLSAGAFYINASSHSIRYYTGSLWLDVSCQAVVTTLAPSNIAGYTATGGGDVVSNGSSPVTLTGLCWSPDANPDTLLTSKTRSIRTGSGIGIFTDLITGLLPNTSYHVRAYAVNSLGLVYGQDVVFSTPVAPPTIITLPVSEETSISAQSGGNISADGGSPVTHRGVIWSSLSDPQNDDSHTVIDDGSGVGYFPSTLDWLLGNTTYYVRAYAVNVAGTAYGNLIVFTTPSPEVPKFLSSAKALSTVGDSATAMATLMNNGGALVTSRGICYRVSGSNSQTCVASSTVTPTDIGSFVSTLTNLLQGTTYYIKGYAVNSVGIGYSTESSFVTSSLTTIVTTPPVTTGGTTADGGGEITNSGYTVISARGVCWDTLPNPTINLTTKTSDAVLDDGTGVYSSSLSGLTPGLTYYVRAYAINSAGVAYGNLDSLLTAALPTLTTAHPIGISNIHAIAGGTISDDGREPVTSRGVCWSLRSNPTIAFSDSLKSMGSDIGSFSDTINNLLGSKKYYIRAYATNSVGTGYGSLDSLTTLAPGLSHVETTNVQVTHGATASVGAIAGATGNVRDNGGALVSERGFCWSTVYIPTHADSHVISGQGNGTFTADLTGLVENTNYYVRAYALNSIGIAYGNLDSITTPISGYPAVSTTDAINITTSSVTMRGNVADDGGGAIRERGFCWSSSLNPVIGDPGVSVVISALGSGTGSFSGDLSGLSPGTTYHFRAYAINSRGTSYGNDLPFSTYTFASIVTKQATSVSSVGAASGGAILNDGGRPVTQSGICWSTSVDPTIADLHTTRGTGIRDFTDTITNSLGSTTYYIRAYAINAAGIAYGANETFTTLPPVYPSITSTGGKSADTGTSASCGGQLNSNGGALILSKGILWSTTSGFTPTITSSDKTVLTGEGDFSSTLTNLTPGTTYYFRAYATNSVGTRYADNELSFTACNKPTVITLVPFSTTNVGTTTGGNITSTGGLGILESGVCWSTTTLPTINDEHQLNAGGIIFSSTITELMGNTTYYVRAYAKNSLGLSYGQVETFTTLAPMLATIQTLQPTATSPTTATMGGKIVSHGGSPITTRGVYWSTTSGFTPSASVSHTAETGSFTGSYGYGISGLTPNTMYYVRAYVVNGLGTSYGAEINFRTFNAFSITTKPATAITSTGAQSGGNILSDGGFKVYCSGICWNSTGNPVMSNYNTIGGPGIGEFIHGISNLTGSATYYIRAYALNDTGVHYGQQEVFTTLPPDNPILTTTVVGSGRTGTTGTCGGIINSNGGAPILSKGILWSTISGFIPSVTSPNKTILSGDGNFSSTFGSLLPATTYYARAYATNNAGTGYAGNEISFTTFNVPELTTTVPYSVTNVTVNTGGTIVSNGGQPILDSGVCWSTSNSPTIADNYLNGGSAYGLFIKTLTELMGSTTYYVRSYATNSVGTGYGQVESFTTQPPMLATILTTTPVATSSVSGSAGGNIISHGGAMVTTRGVYWSTTPDFVPSASVAHTAQTGYFTGTFVDNMLNLLPNTIYYVRAYVVNSVGTAYGAQMNFKTPTLPVLSTQTAISNGPTKASSGGTIIDDGGAPIRAKGIVWSKVPGFNPDTVTVYRTSDGVGSTSFTSLLAGLKGSTTYYVQAYAVNVAGTGYGNLLSFITDPPKLATLTTSDVSSLSGTAATAGGTISDNGGEPILTRGMVWSQYPGFRPDTVVYNKNLDGAMGLGIFSSTMTGLKRGTTYYIRAYATNSVGIAFGNEQSFTTYDLPVLTTESVSPDALGTTASGGGVIQTDGGTPITNQGVCWNTTSGPTTGLFTKTSGDVVSHDSIRSALTNLTPGTTYYVRAYAVNSEGTSYGNEVSFTTPPAIPILTTTYAIITSQSSITTGGKISTANGAPVTSRGIVWSTNLNFNPDTVTVNRTVNGSGTGSFISIITGMQQRIFYYIKAYAVNSVGTGYGNQVTVTLFPTSPVLETTEVTGLGGTTALSGGRIISDGGAVVTAKGVCWNIKTNPTTDNSHTYNGSGNDPYTANITGLLPNTMYYVRAYAINKIGTAYGPEKVILTNNIPTLAGTTPATNVIATVATSGGEVTDDGRSPILYRGICWSTYPDPDISLATKTVDSTSHVIGSFTANMKGLTPNRTYYVRAYATNAVGTGYGSMIQFTTLPVRLPTLTTLTPLPLDSATALSGGNITDDGGMPITDRGVCWSRYRDFTIVGSPKAYDHIRDTIGTYRDSVVGMDPGTKYYVKAFAINSKGVAYGNLDSLVTPAVLARVSSVMISNITKFSANALASVITDGGDSVTVRGFCWNRTGRPTIANDTLQVGNGIGSFADTLKNLVEGKTYYVRAFAINSIGIAYSAVDASFQICPTAFTVLHVEGLNGAPVTKTVTYGSVSTNISGAAKCWITQNLGADHQAVSSTDGTEPSAGWYWQFNRAQGYKHDGTTRTPATWIATINENSDWMPANDPCNLLLANGWRMPTSTEWTNADGVPQNWANITDAYNSILKLHAGGYLYNGAMTLKGSSGEFWSSTQANATTGIYLNSTTSSSSIVNNTNNAKSAYGFSLRCLRDSVVISAPLVSDVTITGKSNTAVTATAATSPDGGAPVTARGFCWNTTGTPTMTDHLIAEGNSIGIFTDSITGLVEGTTYYIRAYATNRIGTTYSSTVTQFKVCPPQFTVQHIAGMNGAPVAKTVVYHSVSTTLSGAARCWITQNLGADHQATSVTDGTEPSAGWYWQFNRSQGYMYDGTIKTPSNALKPWVASISENSDWQAVNDPCNLLLGSGWRLPTATEWTNACGSPQNWTNATDAFNSVLKLHFAGWINWSDGSPGTRGSSNTNAHWWSSTQHDVSQSYIYVMNSTNSLVAYTSTYKSHGFTVRCIRDTLTISVPSVSNVTVPTTTMTANAAVGNATVILDGGANLLERGIVWNTSGNPTVSDNKVVTGSGLGVISETLSGLQEGPTYYVRAFATNSKGTVYSPNVTTFKICPTSFDVIHTAGLNGAPVSKTVTYHSVSTTLSGSAMCWLTQNLGADQQAAALTDATEASSGWYWQFNRIQGYKHDGTTRTPATLWISAISETSDWLSANDPCNRLLGTGWRLPTSLEYSNVITNGGVPFSSPLKLHNSGYLAWNAGGMVNGRGTTQGNYWSATSVSTTGAFDLYNVGNILQPDNKANTFALRCLRDMLVISAPSVSDVTFSNMTSTSADVSAAVTPDGGSPVTERGFCWNTTGVPTTTDNVVRSGLGLGTFTGTVTGGLVQGPTYYVRAYAINKIGISYGTVNSFKICPDTFSITHIAGFNGAPVSKKVLYRSISSTLSGKAVCWLTQNLGADQQATALTDATEASSGWYWQFNRIQGYKHDGTTRTPATSWISAISETSDWLPVNDPCNRLLGTGWRLPTSLEYSNVITNGGVPFSSPLKLHNSGYLAWNAGGMVNGRGTTQGNYWSATSVSATGAFDLYNVGNNLLTDNKANTFALRCLRDVLVISAPSVSDVTFSNMTSISADVSAVVTPDGGAPVTERGFCWNTTGVPTTTDNVVRSGLGLGTFTGTITGGLVQGPTYYVRAYATNKIGISYGTVNSFKICPDTFSVTHIAGFNGAPVSKKVLYRSVSSTLSGKAVCWTTQNLGADQQATALTDATEASSGWYWQFNRIQGYKHDGTTRTPATSWISAISETSDWLPTNDPCNRLLGTGWRLPTSLEYSNVITNGGVPFSSPLKLHNSGYLAWNAGGMVNGRGTTQGNYWSATSVSATGAFDLYNVGSNLLTDNKANTFALRCLRDTLVLSAPSVSDVTFSNMTSTSADVSAAVTPDGGSPVTERGFCWNTTGVPTTTDNVVRSGLGLGTFTGTIAGGLVQGPTYYVRAYAINKTGISYSAVNSFRICPAAFTVQHIAGIDGAPVSKVVTYHSVSSTLSGKAVCWITQNLGADQQPTALTDATEASAGWYWQFNRIQGFKHDGTTRTPALSWIAIDETSDWLSANDPCTRLLGSGWRIPTSLEYSNVITNGGVPYSSPLKLHNSGYLVWNSGVLTGRGTQGNYWNSTMGSTTNAYELYNVGSSLVNDNKAYGFTVRCLRDAIVISPPSVGQVAVNASSMTGTSASVSAAVGSDGGAPVSARGFCWNLTGNPTLSDNHITDSAVGTGNFAGTISGLTYGPKYYIRAYATNTAGTAYSEGTGFNAVLTDICPDTFNIQHTVGVRGAPLTKAVTYRAVQTSLSGATHCWITQNLGADHPATSADDATDASGGWFFQFNRSLGYAQVGTTHTPAAWTSSISENSDWTLINDPCNIMLGADWRLPTSTEWTNVDGAPQNWTTYTDAYNSVLKLHDAGIIVINNGVTSHGGQGDYWSSTSAGANAAYDLQFWAGKSALQSDYKAYGFPVRCLRDAIAKVPPTLGAVVVPTATMTDSTAQGTATILQNGGSPITERGLCWNTTGIPTITDHKVIYSASDMTYTSLMTGLTAGVTYYVRAYAMNNIGIGYSSTVTSFKKCNPVSTIHVAGFNGAPVSKSVSYGTVATNISGKLMCWTTQNLGADQQATSATDATDASAGWYWQFNRAQGYQYTTARIPGTWVSPINENSDWVLANDPCNLLLGNGWRIPTNTEWTNAKGAPQNWANTYNAYNSVLKLHNGGYLGNGGILYARSVQINYWSSTQVNSTDAYCIYTTLSSLGIAGVDANSKSKYAFALRCLRDSIVVSKPSVSDVTITGKSKTAVTAAAATLDNGAPVTARGFYWNTTDNPTTADHVSSEGNNIGAFSDSITGLAENTTYYIRAYATNKVGTSYGAVNSFIVCPAAFTVPHVAGFNGAPVSKTVTYNSVSSALSGKAVCWITQNLGADQQATSATDATEPSAGWYWQFNRVQGYKHDGTTRTPATSWITAISETSDWLPANDPCNLLLGAGWRIPTATEWTNVNSTAGLKNYNDAYASVLKMHAGGDILCSSGAMELKASQGTFWSSSASNVANATFFYFQSSASAMTSIYSKSYGLTLRCLRDALVLSAPSVSAVTFANMTSTSADVSAAVTPDGGSPVTERGFCWNTAGTPTTADNIVSAGLGVGAFTGTIAGGLVQGPTYYVRAYATNKIGTTYGAVNSFRVCPPAFTVQHIAGIDGAPVSKTITYHSVSSTLSGKAVCWITQNLGADQQATALTDATEASAGWYWQFNRIQGFKHDGTTRTPALSWIAIDETSDWLSANDPCTRLLGSGWRIPTSTEYTNVIANGGIPYSSLLKLHNSGYLVWNSGVLTGRGTQGNYWNSTMGSTTNAYELYNVGVALVNDNKAYGFSVRCLRDTIVIAAPSVGQIAVDASSMTGASAGVSAAVGSDGGALVNARGFCWNLTGNPTLSDNHITDAAIGTGNFAGTITGLTEGPKYYIRAYATNSAGTAYSEGTGFNAVLTTICPDTFNIQHTVGVRGVPVTKSVTYHAVGTYLSGAARCWIIQNLGADHPAISVTDATEASAGWYFQFNRSLGYKHDGTTRTPVAWTTAITETSNWTLINDPCNIMLGTDWRIPTSTEYTNVINNGGVPFASPLKLHNSGYLAYGTGALGGRGTQGNYWSSTMGSTTNAFELYNIGVTLVNDNKAYDFPVRCLRDALVKMPPTLGAVVVPMATMTDSTAQGTATILQDGNSAIMEWGLCWNTTGIPTITDHKVIYSASDMTYTSLMTGLTAGVTYYVRAYAVNKIGLSYSPTVTSFKKCNPVSAIHIAGLNGAPVSKTVTYGTVATNISGKLMCWITQNLGADHQAVSVGDATEPSGGWYWQFNRAQGYQYTTSYYPTTWTAVNESSDWVPANDPCNLLLGSGWRIPTYVEWANAVGAPQNWANSTNTYNSVLKLHGAGYLSNGSMVSRGVTGEFWTSTQTSATNGGNLGYNTTVCIMQNNVKSTYGFSLRCIRDSVLVSKPAVSDVTITGKSKTTVTATAAVAVDNGSPVTARGFCWNTTGNPTTADHMISEGNNTGAFTDSIAGLAEGVTYYIRAYAINRIGTAYSFTVMQFKVCPPVFTVQHIEGIDGVPVSKTVTYHSVSSAISGKAVCWITQNLGADSIATAATDATEKSAGWYWQFNRVQGFQYTTVRYPSPWVSAINENSNWIPANDPCVLLLGTGWRIPINSEWTAAKGTPQNWANCNDAYNSILKLHNAGYLNSSTIVNRSVQGDHWSSTQINNTDGYYTSYTSSGFGIAGVDANSKSKYAFSLRCLRDTVVMSSPTVRNVTLSDITSSSASVSAIVTPDGGSPVTERGFCWNTTGNPTVANNKIIDGSAGTGAFSATLSGLAPTTNYYVCAYAINNAGTAYSPVVKSFMTNPPLTVSSIMPSTGPTAGGTNVTITGTNFILPNSGGDAGWATVNGMALPAGLQCSQQAVIGDKVYLFGGHNGSAYVNAIYSAPVSDPTTWSNTGKTLPGNLYSSQLALVGSNLYLFGGYNGTAASNVIYTASVSDPTTWTVVSGKTLPGNLYLSQLAVVDNSLYLFGGNNGTATTNVIYTASISDPTTWSNTGKTLPGNLYASQVAVVGRNLYLFGGYNGSAYTNVIYTAPVSDPTTWTNIEKTLPAINAYAQLVTVGDYLYLLGGYNGSASVSSIFTASIADPTRWTTSASALPAALRASSVAVIGDYAYLVGGYSTAVTGAIYRAPLTHNRPNAYNKAWLTNWRTIATDQSNVTIGGNQAAYINFASSTSITADTPPHPVGATDVVVTNYDGQSATLTNGFTYLPPTISSISPDNGPTAGGTTLTITGANFVGSVGTGSDGPITINANKDINTDAIATGRTCADAVNYSVTALTANTATLSTAPAAGCLAAGDEILLINQQGTNTNYANVGNYETLRIQSISSNVVTFTTNKTKYYGNNTTDDTNIGIATSNQRVMLQRVPNYTDVTVNLGMTLTADGWNGTKGGVLYFKASGVVTNNGTISMSGKGYRAGSGCNGNCSGRRGESCPGYLNDQTNQAYYGAGGGGRYWSGSGDQGDGGGGGSYGSAGLAGAGPSGGFAGSVYGIQDLSTAYLGSGGGGGGGNTDAYVGNGGPGGLGGGLIMLAAGKFLNGGSISSCGNDGANAYDPGDGEPGSGGGGSGGSILFNVTNSILGSNLILANGGAGGYVSVPGGAGGVGRIATLYRNRISGSAVPAAYSRQISGGTTIRVSFGGTEVYGTVINSTTIVVNAPVHTAGATDVIVTNCDGQSATFTNGYTYNAPPTVSSITPATSLRTGGGTVTISGSAFFGTSTVKIGGADATSVSRIDANTLSVVVPAHAVGTFDVLVTNPYSQSATLANAFTFAELSPTVSSISPNNGSAAGGTNVTITGTNFILPNSGGDAGWATVSGKALPAALCGSQQAVIGDKIYLFGGHNSSANVNVIYSAPVSDPTTWSDTGKTLPGNLYGSQLAKVGNNLYLFGGYNLTTTTNVIYTASVSDPTSWTVVSGKTLPGNLYLSQLAIIDNSLYLFGGYNSTATTNVIYTASISDPTTWSNTGKTLPGNLYGSQVAKVGSNLYLFGGHNGVSASNVIYTAPVSDPTTWTKIDRTLPAAKVYVQLVTVGDSLCLLGGYNGNASVSSIFTASITDPTTWTISTSTLPAALHVSNVAVVDDYVYLMGGCTTSASNTIYRAPLTHNRPNVYNKFWMTNWRTIATDQSNVTIGGNQATNINFVSPTSITAATPAHTVGATDVVVTNYDGQSATFTSGYTYW